MHEDLICVSNFSPYLYEFILFKFLLIIAMYASDRPQYF